MSKKTDTAPQEIQLILAHLGREPITGQFRDLHLGQILIYLQMWKTGQWKKTLSKLAIRMGMTVRGIRENYLEGLEAEGIITTSRSSDAILWSWVGLPEDTDVETLSAYVERKKKKQKRGDKNGKDKHE